jgi:hypothetical protein
LATNGGGAEGRRPRLHFDHVQIAVAALDVAADEFAKRYGLIAQDGGRHPGRGTANMIIPLGDSYLELIAVVDGSEARSFATSMRVQRALESGRTFAAWAARTEDMERTTASLAPQEGSPSPPEMWDGRRRRPDGQELSWKSAELTPQGDFSALPFLIEWRVPRELFPGSFPAGGRPSVGRFASILLTDPDADAARQKLRNVLAEDFDYSVAQGPAGVAEITLDTPSGQLRLR